MLNLRQVLKNNALIRNFHSSTRLNNATTTVFVNDQEVVVPSNATVLQACEKAGVTIPRFCYHERLSVAGNCRMCLVEVEKVPKPVASCAWPLQPNMRIKTETEMVKRAREGVMEFLLSNHPLDCPICDQGGECDLQDQSHAYGSDRSRFREIKRSVEDKYLGPIVKTTMTRCIHCTRCVRFSKEVAGVPTLGVTGRGNSMEIGTYVDKVFDSEMSGNVIDLCPVGALTSKPYAFKARPWELTSTESIDVMDAVGSNIRVDTRGFDVMRVLPRLNEDINEEWISDKTRYAIDGLNRQRLDTPLIRDNNTLLLTPASWQNALNEIKDKLSNIQGNELKAIIGDLADAESIMALKDFCNSFGSDNFEFADGISLNADLRSNYTFNSTINGIDNSDLIILVGTNPRMEAAVINARIRRNVSQRNLNVYGIGPEADLALKTKWLGNDVGVLKSILTNNHPLCKTIQEAKRPMFIFGMSSFQGSNGSIMNDVITTLPKVYNNLYTPTWNGLNILHVSASRVAAQDLGAIQTPNAVEYNINNNNKSKVAILLGADSEYVKNYINNNKDTYVIYIGHNGDIGASLADVVLPSTAYTEKNMTYVNTEGRAQKTYKATGVKGLARDDWKIIRALSEVMDITLPYNNIDELKQRMLYVAPNILEIDEVPPQSISYLSSNKDNVNAIANKLQSAPFKPYYDNHYMTNLVARASQTLSKASSEFPVSRNSYITPQ